MARISKVFHNRDVPAIGMDGEIVRKLDNRLDLLERLRQAEQERLDEDDAA